MKVFILIFSDCWAEGFEILGVYQDEKLAEHAINRVIETGYHNRNNFEIRKEVIQVW